MKANRSQFGRSCSRSLPELINNVNMVEGTKHRPRCGEFTLGMLFTVTRLLESHFIHFSSMPSCERRPVVDIMVVRVAS